MGICLYCRQKAGWFSDVHGACLAKAAASVESIKNSMTDTVVEGRRYGEVPTNIDSIIATGLSADRIRAAQKEGWSQGAEQRSKAQPVSDDERVAIHDIHRAAGLGDDEVITKTSGSHALLYSNLTWQVLHDTLTPYEGPIQFNLQAGEVPVWGLANVFLKQLTTTTTYVGGYSGASVRVASGLWYHLGGLRGHKEESTFLQELDAGEILITDSAIYFSGRARGGSGLNFRLPFNQIIRFKPYSDAVGICRNGQREQVLAPRIVVWEDATLSGPRDIGYYLFNLLQALAAKNSAARVSVRG